MTINKTIQKDKTYELNYARLASEMSANGYGIKKINQYAIKIYNPENELDDYIVFKHKKNELVEVCNFENNSQKEQHDKMVSMVSKSLDEQIKEMDDIQKTVDSFEKIDGISSVLIAKQLTEEIKLSEYAEQDISKFTFKDANGKDFFTLSGKQENDKSYLTIDFGKAYKNTSLQVDVSETINNNQILETSEQLKNFNDIIKQSLEAAKIDDKEFNLTFKGEKPKFQCDREWLEKLGQAQDNLKNIQVGLIEHLGSAGKVSKELVEGIIKVNGYKEEFNPLHGKLGSGMYILKGPLKDIPEGFKEADKINEQIKTYLKKEKELNKTGKDLDFMKSAISYRVNYDNLVKDMNIYEKAGVDLKIQAMKADMYIQSVKENVKAFIKENGEKANSFVSDIIDKAKKKIDDINKKITEKYNEMAYKFKNMINSLNNFKDSIKTDFIQKFNDGKDFTIDTYKKCEKKKNDIVNDINDTKNNIIKSAKELFDDIKFNIKEYTSGIGIVFDKDKNIQDKLENKLYNELILPKILGKDLAGFTKELSNNRTYEELKEYAKTDSINEVWNGHKDNVSAFKEFENIKNAKETIEITKGYAKALSSTMVDVAKSGVRQDELINDIKKVLEKYQMNCGLKVGEVPFDVEKFTKEIVEMDERLYNKFQFNKEYDEYMESKDAQSKDDGER